MMELRKLFEFLYGNGCDSMKIAVWLMTNQAIVDRENVVNRIHVVTELYDEILSPQYNEHYFDVEQQRELELPGLNG